MAKVPAFSVMNILIFSEFIYLKISKFHATNTFEMRGTMQAVTLVNRGKCEELQIVLLHYPTLNTLELKT